MLISGICKRYSSKLLLASLCICRLIRLFQTVLFIVVGIWVMLLVQHLIILLQMIKPTFYFGKPIPSLLSKHVISMMNLSQWHAHDPALSGQWTFTFPWQVMVKDRLPYFLGFFSGTVTVWECFWSSWSQIGKIWMRVMEKERTKQGWEMEIPTNRVKSPIVSKLNS